MPRLFLGGLTDFGGIVLLQHFFLGDCSTIDLPLDSLFCQIMLYYFKLLIYKVDFRNKIG